MEEVLEFDLKEFGQVDDKTRLLAPKKIIQRKWSSLKSLTITLFDESDYDNEALLIALDNWLVFWSNSIKCIGNSKLQNLTLIFDFEFVPWRQYMSLSITNVVKEICVAFPLLKTFHLDVSPLQISWFSFEDSMVMVYEKLKYLSMFIISVKNTGIALKHYHDGLKSKEFANSSLTYININKCIPFDNIVECRRIEQNGPVYFQPYPDLTEVYDPQTTALIRKNKAQRKFFTEIFFTLHIGVKKRLGLLGLINKDCVTLMLSFLQPKDLYYDFEKEKQEMQYASVVVNARNRYLRHTSRLKNIEHETTRIDLQIRDLTDRKRKLDAEKKMTIERKKQVGAELNKIIKDGRGF